MAGILRFFYYAQITVFDKINAACFHTLEVAISLIHLKRLPRPLMAHKDIVKIYIAFIVVFFYRIVLYLLSLTKNSSCAIDFVRKTRKFSNSQSNFFRLMVLR